jgi:hypothetical protein
MKNNGNRFRRSLHLNLDIAQEISRVLKSLRQSDETTMMSLVIENSESQCGLDAMEILNGSEGSVDAPLDEFQSQKPSKAAFVTYAFDVLFDRVPLPISPRDVYARLLTDVDDTDNIDSAYDEGDF